MAIKMKLGTLRQTDTTDFHLPNLLKILHFYLTLLRLYFLLNSFFKQILEQKPCFYQGIE